jgi:hypothetical protein
VEKKQVANLHARLNVARGDLDAAIRADIERLVPGAIKQLEVAATTGEVDLRAIAAGELEPDKG